MDPTSPNMKSIRAEITVNQSNGQQLVVRPRVIPKYFTHMPIDLSFFVGQRPLTRHLNRVQPLEGENGWVSKRKAIMYRYRNCKTCVRHSMTMLPCGLTDLYQAFPRFEDCAKPIQEPETCLHCPIAASEQEVPQYRLDVYLCHRILSEI